MAEGSLLVVLTGPSGAGKDSVLAHLKSAGRPYHFGVNATTRPPRPAEVEGVDYHFVSVPEFERMIAAGELLEHAMVYDQHKGVPKAPIREAIRRGQDVVFRTDIQGARTIKSIVPSAITIFVAAPSELELERRLRTRGEDAAEQMELRLRIAKEETAVAAEFDYTVVNDDLERCSAEIEAILSHERARPAQKAVVLP